MAQLWRHATQTVEPNLNMRTWYRLSTNALYPGCPAVMLVESPAKAKKIQEFVGSDFQVLASYGHIRDLPAKAGSVLPDANFQVKWELTDGARVRVDGIVAAVKSASRVVLATDPDREGEAISWHLLEELRERGALQPGANAERVTFTEVTAAAVKEALKNPRELSTPLVEAYMARRALDYLFGFTLSPLLWRKLPGARSAGRVQSVALKLVAEREAAIESFEPVKYWTVQSYIEIPGASKPLIATLKSLDGEAPPKPGFLDETAAQEVVARLASGRFVVCALNKRQTARHPSPPFSTSTMQQEASSRLGMSVSRTMQLAQKLYEAGLITYMRTDGVAVSLAAVTALREAAAQLYGEHCVPEKPRAYATKTKNAQEAHEAIRPTDPSTTPEAIAALGFEPVAVSLYNLVRRRAIASQMASAKVDQVSVDFANEDGSVKLRATASHVAFPGFLLAYGLDAKEEEDPDESKEPQDSGSPGTLSGMAAARVLTSLSAGDAVALLSPEALGRETGPPNRYSEASLVKDLELAGIGRPSTYAPTVKLLQARRYVMKEGRALHAEPLGRVLSTFLSTFFPKYVDYDFTSRMEADLDTISAGQADWRQLLEAFWGPFQSQVKEMGSLSGTEVIDLLNKELELLLFGKQEGMGAEHANEQTTSGRACPACGKPLSLKLSHKGGPFVGCSTYPECNYARPVAYDEKDGQFHRKGDASGGSDVGRSGLSSLDIAEKYGMRGPVRLLGLNDQGKEVFMRQGPYGPYVQLGPDKDPHMRRAPLPKDYNRYVRLEYALSLLALPKELGVHPETGAVVEVRNGKFGPFVMHGGTKRSIPKEVDPLTLSLEAGLHLLGAPDRRKRKVGSTEALRTMDRTSKETAGKRGRKRKALTAENAVDSIGQENEISHPKIMRARSAYQLFLQGNGGVSLLVEYFCSFNDEILT